MGIKLNWDSANMSSSMNILWHKVGIVMLFELNEKL